MTDPQVIVNLGTGGTGLNATNGSSSSADSNDARFLDWPGDNTGNYMYIPGTTNNFLRVTDEAALDITGDLDLRVWLAMDDWTSSSDRALIRKWFGSDGNSYQLILQSSSFLFFGFQDSGGTPRDRTSTIALPSASAVDFQPLWVRVTLDVDNGASGNDTRFFYSSDGVTWTQLGTTVTVAGTTSVRATNSDLFCGEFIGGKVYRGQVLNGIGGTTVLDIDTSRITTGSATSFTATTGQTVTIARSTSGSKSVAVVSPVFLFGTDDYMEIADNALLDFTSTDPFTLLVVHRPWATQGTNDTLLAKKANTTQTTQGWNLSGGTATALLGQSQIGDGTNGLTAVSGTRTAGALTTTTAVRDITSDTLRVYVGSTAGSAVTDTTTGSLANSEVVRVGRLSGAGTEYLDAEVFSVAVWRRALSATEVGQVSSYFTNRIGA